MLIFAELLLLTLPDYFPIKSYIPQYSIFINFKDSHGVMAELTAPALALVVPRQQYPTS